GPGYLAWLASKGFTQAQFDASGFTVDVSDSGLDNGTASPNHPGLYVGGNITNASRVVYNRLEGTTNAGSTLHGCDGHGTLNSHIIGGFNNLPNGFPHTDGSGFYYGLGVCPFVKIGSSVIFDSDTFTSPNFATLQSSAFHDGARVSNNSWGGNAAGAYDARAQTYDALVRDAQPAGAQFPAAGNQEMVIVFAAGNAGPVVQTIGSPGSAKNVISVGAAESVQAIGGSDRSGVSDAQADSANDIVSFSSRGPCADGRHKPDLVAPGTHVSGGVAQDINPGVNGTADPCFTGAGVSGAGVGIHFFPAGQQWYTASSGTSHSTPCVAGGCALVRQYFINQFTNTPSPAMTKGYLMNSARYLNGADANDTLWSNSQGMGEMNLGFAFDGTPRILRDEVPADLFTASGQTRTFTGTISDTNKPFRVTIVWTDAPGNTTGNAYNNDLDLIVTAGGNTYKGNVFDGASSTTGGTADTTNNAESVFLPAGLSGKFSVQVTAANINSDGVPNNSHPLDQDFALVIYNATGPLVNALDPILGAENCFPTNGLIDPGETVTMNIALQNVGNASTTNLVATLQATGGVVNPNGPQTYGGLTPGAAAASRPFTFTANGTCGGTITATLQLQDGPVNLGSVSFNLSLGKFLPITTLVEYFDVVTAPALPTDWTTSVSDAGVSWESSTGAADSAPNAVFAAEPPSPGLTELVTPSIPILSSAAQLTFRNRYDIEGDPIASSAAYDGGVLEIAIGNGGFTDILAAGGGFAGGGYTATVDPADDNPLAGRQVWSGNSGGFITTTVNLPAAAAGQSVRFKWVLGTDTANGFGGTGWYIDSVSIQDGTYTCCNGLFAPTIVNPRTSGGNVTFSFQTINGQTYNVEYKDTVTNATWTTLQSFSGDGSVKTITNALSTPQRFYRVRSP
ncbi:MAG: conserved repeat domain protein, partial [Pedosphaera sp.]|nr:conserved repeat domain protein [Pedosphaera sp.]